MYAYMIQPANVLLFSHICKFLLLFFAYLHFFLYFCSVKAQIMAIGNVTPDSFYAASRLDSEQAVLAWAKSALTDGADILDIGACSTRPGSTPVSEEEEWARLVPALRVLRAELPNCSLSLDTFRPVIARRALEQFGPMMINDISGDCGAMAEFVRAHHAPYIWTLRGDLTLPACHPEWSDLNLVLDPGFGFIGSTEADYTCMKQMHQLQVFNRPILVGVSRKSMLWRPLGLTPETSLCATQAMHMYTLQQGATILRTHDVKETAQTVRLYEMLTKK